MKRMVFAVVLIAVLMIGSEVLAGGHWGCWTQMNPADSPTGRIGHTMAYDIQSDRVMMFGGWDCVQPPNDHWFDDTWAYDLNTDTWTQMNPANHPSARARAPIAYDAESDRVVLFGGYRGGGGGHYFDDTWAYNFNTDTWTQMYPTDHPSARASHATAYVAEGDRVILFGGWDSANHEYVNDTWAYDFNINTWTQMNPPNRPRARTKHAMAYDAGSDRVIVFGGRYAPYTFLDDTWAYDYSTDTWTEMSPARHPENRCGCGIAYDAKSDRVILFGGYGDNGWLSDTWAYDYDTDAWTEMDPPNHPGAREDSAMPYDAESERVVLFGGHLQGSCYDETSAFQAGVFYAPEDWLWPFWNWIAIPAIPDDPDPSQVLGFDCGGRIWYWDKYGKTAQVYQPPFVTFDMMVGDSYLLWLDEVPGPVWYEGGFVRMPFEFKLGRMGWTWLGMPRLTDLGTTDFMDNVCVQYPVGGPVRTAAEDYASTPDNWLQWGWSFWDGQAQAPKTFTPYAPFGDNVCYPWVGYRCWINVGDALDEGDPDQVTIIWP